MGFSVLLDIIGSIIIGGILLNILLRLTDSSAEKTLNYSGELSLQQALVTVAQIIEHDFRKMGYCANWQNFPDPTRAIIQADTSLIRFYTDIDNNGNIDSIRYYLGPTSECANTPNPRDRKLYRVVNTETPQTSNVGVTQFYLTYFDAYGDTLNLPITDPRLINSFEINVQVENSYAYDNKYSSAFWRQIRLVARNLRNR